MNYRDLIGQWKINANNYLGNLEFWRDQNAWNGRIWFDVYQRWEILSNISFNSGSGELLFTRENQGYRGILSFDELVGSFTSGGDSYTWRAQRNLSTLSGIESSNPGVAFLSARSGAPSAPKVLVLVEERILDGLLSTLSGGLSVLQRYLDDLQNEDYEVYAYSYDIRNHETGEQYHCHLPSEVLELYKYIRTFYHASDGSLSGVVLVGDFPAAGVNVVKDRKVGDALEQHEMDYFCVDSLLADPFGYWEWLPTAPMVPPGNTKTLRLPFDEGRHPNGSLYPRTQWSAPGFVSFRHTEINVRQPEVHHSQRSQNNFGSDPKYWIGRISASQAAWRTGIQGWEYSIEEEIRLLVDYFNRNHTHRTTQRNKHGYIFLDEDFANSWQNEKNKMTAVIPQQDITVHADNPNFTPSQKASITNFFASFQNDYLICQYVMHSDWLNHSFAAESGQDIFPTSFPDSYKSPGSNVELDIPHGGGVKSKHLIAIPNKSPFSRFYLLGGCDVGAIIHRPQFLINGENISPATPLHRQYGAFVLGVAYLMQANGLAVLAHNVANPPGDYTIVYNNLQQGKSFGEGVLELMKDENNSKLPHYRNVIFGDPTLRLSY